MICTRCQASIDDEEVPLEVHGNTGHCPACALELDEVLSCDACGDLVLRPTINIPGRDPIHVHLGHPFLCAECTELDQRDAEAELDYLRRHHGPGQ